MQAREHRINWEIYAPYAGAAGMLLLRNGKFTIGKLKLSLVFSTDPHCQFLDVSQDDADLTVSVVSFISIPKGLNTVCLVQ